MENIALIGIDLGKNSFACQHPCQRFAPYLAVCNA